MLRKFQLILAACVLTSTAQAGYTSYGECIEHNLLSKNLIIAIQEVLKKEGRYSGKADGLLGKSTRKAIQDRNRELGGRADYVDKAFLVAILGKDAEDINMDEATKACAFMR